MLAVPRPRCNASRTYHPVACCNARDLVAGSWFRFEDLGTRPLKGIPEPWRLFALAGTGPA